MNPQAMMLSKWVKDVGICRHTALRWRNLGMLTAQANIFGKIVITAEDDAKFWARVKAGEFAKELGVIGESAELSKDSPLVKLPAKGIKS